MITDAILATIFLIPKAFLTIMQKLTAFVGPLPDAVTDSIRWVGEVLRIFDPLCPPETPCSSSFLTFLVSLLTMLIVAAVIRAVQLVLTLVRGVKMSHENAPDMG